MSRSRPTQNTPHPCVRWFEWSGSNGVLKYYDKDEKTEKTIPDGFVCMVLDDLSAVRGWDETSESSITSNEVRDTRSDVMVVKSFKGGEIAHGLYKDIRDRVASKGGHYVSNIYVAFKLDGQLQLGCLQLKGAALNSWVDFKKEHKKEIEKKALKFAGVEEGKKGSVKFKTPKFALIDITTETDAMATEVDKKLQEYLDTYLAKKPSQATESQTGLPPSTDSVAGDSLEDDIPF